MFIPCLLFSDVFPSNLSFWYLIGVDTFFTGIFVSMGFKTNNKFCNLKSQQGKIITVDEILRQAQVA